MTNTRELIDDFLAQKRLALVGVSHDSRDFSRTMFRDLIRHGYEMVPVNPKLTEVDGHRCFGRLQDVMPPVDGALLMTPPAQSEQVVRDCLAAGTTRVWLHRGAGTGAVSPAAVDFCHQHGLSVIEGYCPYMFLDSTAAVHRVHRFFFKLTGRHPAARARQPVG
jgi:predicted CoA-binding protein